MQMTRCDETRQEIVRHGNQRKRGPSGKTKSIRSTANSEIQAQPLVENRMDLFWNKMPSERELFIAANYVSERTKHCFGLAI